MSTSFIFRGLDFDSVFKLACQNLLMQPEYAPRGQKTKEFIDATLVIEDPMKCILTNPHRKLSHKYLKAEFDWYLSGRRDIEMIREHSSMWESIANPDGTVNSNYGHFVFYQQMENYGMNQFNWCVNQFIKDEDTRQAIINFNQPIHKYEGNKDFVCTINMQFFIRDKKLQLKVNMRSCDLIYGASFDIPWFVFVHYAMFQVLKQFYPKLEMGKLIHNSASLHLYERHFKMLENIVNDPFTEYKSVDLGSVVDLKESLNIVR